MAQLTLYAELGRILIRPPEIGRRCPRVEKWVLDQHGRLDAEDEPCPPARPAEASLSSRSECASPLTASKRALSAAMSAPTSKQEPPPLQDSTEPPREIRCNSKRWIIATSYMWVNGHSAIDQHENGRSRARWRCCLVTGYSAETRWYSLRGQTEAGLITVTKGRSSTVVQS